ncbi:MAG: alanine racemase [Flavobacteriales bacterium]|nr:alanine racemase [Flavobacteriales bacterium]
MAEKARRNNVIFRPHFKTHQSHEIGSWFRDEGVECITTSSISMAHYFAGDGWTDITVAFPANVLEIDKINELAKSITLNLVVESKDTVIALSKALTEPINLLVKLDIGYHRTGVAPDHVEEIAGIMDEIDRCALTTLRGFLGHAGHSYAAENVDEIARIHVESIDLMNQVKTYFTKRYADLLITVGDTPTCSVMEDFTEVDEIRPGNFVFYDLTQRQIGSCTLEQITIAVACPVVAIHADRNEIIIYGGGVHFSKELLNHPKHGTIFGLVAEDDGERWGALVEDVYLARISQEHGTVHAPSAYLDKIQIGDIVKILPVHSCMTADLHSVYLTTDGTEISRITH